MQFMSIFELIYEFLTLSHCIYVYLHTYQHSFMIDRIRIYHTHTHTCFMHWTLSFIIAILTNGEHSNFNYMYIYRITLQKVLVISF